MPIITAIVSFVLGVVAAQKFNVKVEDITKPVGDATNFLVKKVTKPKDGVEQPK